MRAPWDLFSGILQVSEKWKSQASLSALDVFLQAQKISAWFAVSAAALVATTTSGRLWDVLSLRVKSDIDIIFIYKR